MPIIQVVSPEMRGLTLNTKKSEPFGIEKAFRLFRSFLGSIFTHEPEAPEEVARSMDMDSIYTQILLQVYDRSGFEYPRINNLYFDAQGSMFVVISDSGKLYRAYVSMNSNEATVGEFTAVVVDFTPATRSNLMISRQADGSTRWFLIAGTSVLNRDGEIDSKALYDNLTKRAQDSGKYPYLTFYHLGRRFEMGTVDFLAREGHVGIASGIFHDNEIARTMISAYNSDPEYWGSSISYWPLAQPVLREVADGISVPVYEDGEFEEISLLAERDACSLFTALVSRELVEDETIMDKRIEDALKKLAGGDDDLASRFISMVDGTNSTIEERQLISRAVEGEVVTTTTASNEEDTVTATTGASDTSEDVNTVELDEAAIAAITETILSTEVFRATSDNASKVTEILASLDKLTQSVATLTQKFEQNLEKRVASLEKPVEEHVNEVVADLPRRRTVITYRPSQNAAHTESETSATERAELANVAQDTLSRIK